MVKEVSASLNKERPEKITDRIASLIFPEGDDLRAKIFDLLAICGTVICIITAVNNLVVEGSVGGFIGCVIGMFISFALFMYTKKTGNYKPSMILTIVVIFLVLFTFLFFSGGGYHSGMPAFFIFATVFTAFMLDGIPMLIFVLIEIAWYTFILYWAYINPGSVNDLEGEFTIFLDVLIGETVVAVSLVLTMYLQIRVYRKNQQELRQAIKAADEANRAKSDFLAKMSHDIRTPLNTILAMNELIIDNTSSERIREWVNDSNISGKILLSLIDDMLDLTRIETGRFTVHNRTIDLTLLFRETERLWKPQTERKGLDLICEMSPDVPEFLMGDEDVLRKIINNLMSNAVKFTDTGSVTVRFDWDGEFRFTIADTGVGIDPEYLKIIFNPFERGVQGVYRETSGSGLGLAIVKDLVDAVEGTIDCKSNVGIGTEFTVKLPFRGINSTVEDQGTDESSDEKQTVRRFVAPSANILVVDDIPFNQKVIESYLEPALIHIDSVDSGYEALEMIDIKEYDLILMDLRMPGMDGAETLDKIREEYPDLKTPVIMLTADIISGIGDEMIRRGFDDFLSKPISSADLYEILQKYIPDKMMTIEIEEDKQLSAPRAESYQDLLMPYGISVKMAIENNAGSAGEFLSRALLFEEYADEGIDYLSQPQYDEDYYIRIHSVKSASRGIGAYLLAELAGAVELRKNREFSEMTNGLLIEEYKRVRQGLSRLKEEEERKHG